MQYFMDQNEYRSLMYKRDLRATATHLGVLLLLFFGGEMALSLLAAGLMTSNGAIFTYVSSTSLQLLLNGLLSSAVFFLIGIIYCLIKRLSFARLFPFERTGGKTLAMLCVIGLAFSLMSNYAASMLTDVFALFDVSNRGGDVVGDGGSLPSILLYYLTVAVLPALAEEFAFRGVIMGSLRKYSDAMALLISSAAFALMHGNFVQIPFTFCCGLAFGYIVLKTNSLLPSIIVHFLNNALSVTFDVLTGYGILNARMANLGYCVIIITLCVLSLVFIRKLSKKKPDLFRFSDSDRIIPFRDKLKTAVCSPALISFAVIMVLFSIYSLISPYIVL